MKATIEFDDALYRRLKIEAAKRGRTVREMVAEGVELVLDSKESKGPDSASASTNWRPSWIGGLRSYAEMVEDHSMEAVRKSIAKGHGAEQISDGSA